MVRRYFGTDGIRGRANKVITPELALKVGQAAGLIFKNGEHRHRVLIGKDTRLSGYMIENAMVAGFTSVGMDVLLTGPIPTPAVGMLARSMRADLGVMISASHNPFDDNGIKLFGPDGQKLSDAREHQIEALMANLVNLFDRIVKLTPFLPQEFGAMAKTIASPGVLADMIASIINATLEEKQQILETLDIKERLKEVTRLVNHQVEILELGSKIQSQVKNDMDKSQREYYLRQQLKAIKEELGETDESGVEIDEYREKIAKKNLP